MSTHEDKKRQELHKAFGVYVAETNKITPRAKEIVEHRYALNGKKYKTLNELADDFGVTRSRIRQLEYKTMAILTGFYE